LRKQKFEDHVLYAAPLHNNPILRQAIHHFKYKGAKEVGAELVKLFKEIPQGIFIPVPLHPERQKTRRYNQSLILARTFAQHANSSVLDILLRIKDTAHQAHMNRAERLRNLHNAFAIEKNTSRLSPHEQYFIVDDVSTTGATIQACATILRQHGAHYIAGIVLAHDQVMVNFPSKSGN